MRKVLLLLSVVLVSCERETQLEIERVQIITKDPAMMADWYSEILGFEADQNVLSYQDFKIHLKKNEEASSVDALKKTFQLKQIPGFFKLGFITNQFDELVEKLNKNQVQFVENVTFDKTLDRRSLVVKDPEGNHIQLFEDFGRHQLKPYYLAVVVESIGEQEKWYQMKLPVSKTYNLDHPERNTYVRLLEGDDFLIELICLSDKAVKDELNKLERLGFSSVSIRGANAFFDRDHEGNMIVHQ